MRSEGWGSNDLSWGPMTLKYVEVIRSILSFLPSSFSILVEFHPDDHPPRTEPNARTTMASPYASIHSAQSILSPPPRTHTSRRSAMPGQTTRCEARRCRQVRSACDRRLVDVRECQSVDVDYKDAARECMRTGGGEGTRRAGEAGLGRSFATDITHIRTH